MIDLQRDALVDDPAQQDRELGEEVGRVEDFALERLFPGIGEQAANEVARAHGRFMDRLELII